MVTHIEEERKLRVFENRVLRRISGPKGYDITGGWRKLHNEDINDLYCSPIAGSIPAGVIGIFH